MVFKKRSDGRKFDELRPIEAKVGVIPSADGSAMFKIGDTIAIASVRGPRELYPKFLKNSEKAILRCNYNMMSFSTNERVKPGPSRRSKEISMVTEKALSPFLDLKSFPGAAVDVFIELIQTDSGTRCAGICAASMALADAGIPMKDLVSAIAVGAIDNQIIVDLTKEEEDFEGEVTDLPVAISGRNEEISLLQMDGSLKRELVVKALEIAKKACNQIYQIQKNALLEKYDKKG